MMDYGKQIRVGKHFFANFNFTVLDEAPVTIGAGTSLNLMRAESREK